MKRALWFTLLSITLITLLSSGCTMAPKPKTDPGAEKPKPKPEIVKKPGDYFPLTKGSSWQYLGEGNEYASYTQEVIFVKGNRAQLKTSNGGTVAASVFEITEDTVTRVFFQGEEYKDTNFLDEQPKESVVVLKSPIKVGTRWEEPNGTREIISINEIVETPARTFENCVKVKITNPNSIINNYYKEGVGLVKSEFESEGTRVTSTLEMYTIK